MSNKENRPDTQFFIPYKVTKDDFATMNISFKDVILYQIGGHFIMVYMAPNYDPELYETMRKDFQNQLKAEWREKCCFLSDGKGGFFKCNGPCGNCSHPNENAKRSLEVEFEKNGFEPESGYDDICALDDRITLEMLMEKLNRLDPKCGEVLELLYQGLTERAVADVLGWPRSNVHHFAKKGLSKLKRWYED